MSRPLYKKIYALYKGDDFLADGTISEIAKKTGKSKSFLEYMTYPVYERRRQKSGGKNRLTMVLIDDDDEEGAVV